MTNISGENGGIRVALLIDGENISAKLAGQILMRAGKFGKLIVKRVYGDASALPGWEKAPGIRLIHSGAGKNSADMLLAIQAVDLAHSGSVSSFAIVSSDGDFSHLAHFLVEKGFQVLGVGEKKAPDAFIKACSRFAHVGIGESRIPDLKQANTNLTALANTKGAGMVDSELDQKIAQVIKFNSNGQGLEIAVLGVKMYSQFHVKISEHKEKTWWAYLGARPGKFDLDPRGPGARVRLK